MRLPRGAYLAVSGRSPAHARPKSPANGTPSCLSRSTPWPAASPCLPPRWHGEKSTLRTRTTPLRLGELLATAAMPRPRSRDQLELDALNKYLLRYAPGLTHGPGGG